MLDTHNKVIEFGKFRGERWTRLPVSYLRWLANEATEKEIKEMAESELARRGTTIPHTVELSGHSIDRCSQITRAWERDGVHSWLQRRAEEALLTAGERQEVVFYKGLKFIFCYGEFYPTLKTVMLDKKKLLAKKISYERQ